MQAIAAKRTVVGKSECTKHPHLWRKAVTHPGRRPSSAFSHFLAARTSPAGRLQLASDSNDCAANCGSLILAAAAVDDDDDLISPSAVG